MFINNNPALSHFVCHIYTISSFSVPFNGWHEGKGQSYDDKEFHKIAQIPRKCVLPIIFHYNPLCIIYQIHIRYIYYTLDFLWSDLMK